MGPCPDDNALLDFVHGQLSDSAGRGVEEHIDGSRPPRIADYAGRAPLLAWLRLGAVRLAVSLRRGQHHEVASDEAIAELPMAGADPELAALRARYGGTFRAAVMEAFAALSSHERNLLRLSVLDGLSIDKLAALNHVHRATAARWLLRAREQLLGHARRIVRERLNLTDGDYESLLGAMQSGLDVSIGACLGTRPGEAMPADAPERRPEPGG
ncbi:MAG TPA: sigma factor-like helix-turn-helix DNA-binding protein [Polyangia bacterium]|jgi:RNA polymerase sigma-70 factor (ECF subfamily)